MDPDNAAAAPRPTRFATLPLELCQHVFELLDRPSCKALRMAYPPLRDLGAEYLFSTVVLSKTWLDYQRFSSIAVSDRLSRIPRQLVWYELTADQNDVLLRAKAEQEARKRNPQENDTEYYAALHQMVAGIFWSEPFLENEDRLPSGSGGRRRRRRRRRPTYLARRRIHQSGAEQNLAALLRCLRNLNSLVFRAMPADRLLTLPFRGGFCLTAGLLPAIPVRYLPGRVPNGLFLLTEAALGPLARQIRSLYLAGPYASPARFATDYSVPVDGRDMAGNPARRIFPLAVFYGLRTVDLCFDWWGDEPAHAAQHAFVAFCLQAAQRLRRMSLCFERIPARDGLAADAHTAAKKDLLRAVLADGRRCWPALQALRLSDADYAQGHLLAFLARHASTLRELWLLDCRGHTRSILPAMAGLRLTLTSFQVRSQVPTLEGEDADAGADADAAEGEEGEEEKDGENDGELTPAYYHNGWDYREPYVVREQTLLDYVNNRTTLNPLRRSRRPLFSTGPFVWDAQAQPRYAFLDGMLPAGHTARQWDGHKQRLVGDDDWDWDGNVFLDGDFNGRGGWVPTPIGGAARPKAEPGVEAEPDWPWVWPTRRRLVAPTAAPMPSRYTAEDWAQIEAWVEETADVGAGEADGEDEDGEDEDGEGEDGEGEDGEGEGGEHGEGGEGKDPRRIAARKADRRQDARAELGQQTRWCWARVPRLGRGTGKLPPGNPEEWELDMYYWKTAQPGRGHPTTQWLFHKHDRDGGCVRGCGADPLEFFSDWDSEEGEGGDEGEEGGEGEGGGKRRGKGIVFMKAEPTLFSQAFYEFLRTPRDLGEPLEAGVELKVLQPDDLPPTWVPPLGLGNGASVRGRCRFGEEAADADAEGTPL